MLVRQVMIVTTNFNDLRINMIIIIDYRDCGSFVLIILEFDYVEML